MYLSPAPLYHAAPLAWSMSCHRSGATVVVMERFEPARALQPIEAMGVPHVVGLDGAEDLAGFKCPRSFEFTTEELRTPVGKIRRGPLREQFGTARVLFARHIRHNAH